MNKILIVQFTVGPTHKARLLHNLNTYPAYNRFDVLILTNDVEFFDSVSDRSNIILKDINEIRKDYPWSLELEVIPKEKVDNIFTPFYTTKSLGEGIGLGLYVSKKIINEHDGIIYYSSKEGRTEFIVTLPV